jgi:hypothetical protein
VDERNIDLKNESPRSVAKVAFEAVTLCARFNNLSSSRGFASPHQFDAGTRYAGFEDLL